MNSFYGHYTLAVSMRRQISLHTHTRQRTHTRSKSK